MPHTARPSAVKFDADDPANYREFAENDEFDQSMALGLDAISTPDPKWTISNVSGTDRNIYVTNHHVVMYSVAVQTVRWMGLWQPISGSVWKVRTKVICEAGGWNYCGPMIAARRSAADKHCQFGYVWNSTQYGMSYWSFRIKAAWAFDNETDLTNLQTHVNYLELENDGTNLYFRASRFGTVYTLLQTYASNAYLGGAIDQVGIGIYPYLSSTVTPGVYAFDWFRRIF